MRLLKEFKAQLERRSNSYANFKKPIKTMVCNGWQLVFREGVKMFDRRCDGCGAQNVHMSISDLQHQSSYDAVPYESLPFPQTHPDRLATVARLFGLQPSPVPRCRVLELGCAGGGNLIPMAAALPHAQFVGVELSAVQVATFSSSPHVVCHGANSAWIP